MNKWMQKLFKLDGALVERHDPYVNPLRSASPSANFIYGKTHGLPRGYTEALYGPPKGGKSVYLHMKIGWLHQTDPDAIAVKIDPEFRSDAQLTDEMMAVYGIDPDRLLILQTNSPSACFDQIERDIAGHCQAGAPIRLIGIDSISGIQGRREMENESVEKQTIGDHAQTVQIGLKRILPVIRKHKIGLSLVCQARAEMDLTEQKRGNKFKMQGSFGLQHMAEYFIVVEENRNAAGRKDLMGNEFINPAATDLNDNAEKTAMKIRVKMKNSSLGPKGRLGEFTFHFKDGLVNVHEEVFLLGTNRGIILPGEKSGYIFEGNKWRGKEACLEELRDNAALRDQVVSELQRRDLAGEYASVDAAVARAEEAQDEE